MDTDTHGCGAPASSRSTGRRLEQNCMVMFWGNVILVYTTGAVPRSEAEHRTADILEDEVRGGDGRDARTVHFDDLRRHRFVRPTGCDGSFGHPDLHALGIDAATGELVDAERDGWFGCEHDQIREV